VNFFVQKSIFWPKKHFLANEICALLKNWKCIPFYLKNG
jgi:hypothetical protein